MQRRNFLKFLGALSSAAAAGFSPTEITARPPASILDKLHDGTTKLSESFIMVSASMRAAAGELVMMDLLLRSRENSGFTIAMCTYCHADAIKLAIQAVLTSKTVKVWVLIPEKESSYMTANNFDVGVSVDGVSLGPVHSMSMSAHETDLNARRLA